MTLINVGELVKNLTDNFKTDNSNIPWRNIAGMWDITAHKYQTLKMADVMCGWSAPFVPIVY
jgi:uncharacterized protein with HEPN domain